jgi:hypothetical protein
MRIHSLRSPFVAGILSVALALPPGVVLHGQSPLATAASASLPPGTNADTGWPRTVVLRSGTAVWYQPQIESWASQKKMIGWSAVSYQPTGAKEPALGTIKLEAATQVSLDERVVRLDFDITEFNFKTLAPEQVKTLVADVQALPQNQRVLDLDRVLAYVNNSPLQPKNAEGIKADPPTIYSSTTPAILVNLDGDPIWSSVKDLDLRSPGHGSPSISFPRASRSCLPTTTGRMSRPPCPARSSRARTRRRCTSARSRLN